MLVIIPSATPDNATCDNVSPTIENLLNTRNNPTVEHINDMIIPIINALCINEYDNISTKISPNLMFMRYDSFI